MAKAYQKPGQKLRAIAGGATPKSTSTPKPLRAGGHEATTGMEPGQYVVICEGGRVEPYYKGQRANLVFKIFDGPHEGTALNMWIPLGDVGGVVPIKSRYAKQCKVALGRDIEPGDDLDPAKIFPGHVFLAKVAYRKTEGTRGGEGDEALSLYKKGPDDRLRVHDLMELREL